MKALFITTAALFITAVAAPVSAATPTGGLFDAASIMGDTTVDRRKPRIPGGSGCDDPRDLIEHPECRR
jgi:hypothetical protein